MLKKLGNLLLLFIIGCANTPSGAIEIKTTTYYIDGKFVDEIPREIIGKRYGYLITDSFNGKDHTYRDSVIMYPNQSIVTWCTIHRGWEVVMSRYIPDEATYGVSISKHKKF